MSYILSCDPVLSLKSHMNLRVFRWFMTMLHQFRNCSIIFFSLLVGITSIFRAGTILGMDEGRFSPLRTRTQSDLICSNVCSFMVDKSPCGKII